MSQNPEEERTAARGFELCARILEDQGYSHTAALFDEAQALCNVKAQVLEDIDREAVHFRKSTESDSDPQA